MKFKYESYKSGAIYSTGLSGLVKVIAYAQNFLVAYFLGAGTDTDLYFYILGLIIPVCEIIQGIVTSILVPQSMVIRSRYTLAMEQAYLNSFLYFVLIIVFVLVGIFLSNAQDFLLLLSNFSITEVNTHLFLLYILLPTSILYIFNIVFVEVLASYKYFIAPQIISLVNNLFVIAFLLCFHRAWGVNALAIGFSLGVTINFVWLVLFVKKRLQWHYTHVAFRYLKKDLPNIGLVLVNNSIMAFTTMYPMYLLSMFYPGTVTVVTYAIKLLQGPMMLLVQVFSVLQIKLSELYAGHQKERMKQLFIHISKKIVLLCVTGSTLFFLFRKPIIELLFGHGAMTQNNIEQFVCLMGILIISIPFSILIAWSARMLYALQKVKIYVFVMSGCNIMACGLFYWTIQKAGAQGYAMADVSIEIIKAITIVFGVFYLLKK